jgi:hypothetical protein
MRSAQSVRVRQSEGWYYGADTILDFSGNDFVQISSSLASGFGAAMTHARQLDENVVFDFGNNDILVLANKQIDSLNDGDFIFV